MKYLINNKIFKGKFVEKQMVNVIYLSIAMEAIISVLTIHLSQMPKNAKMEKLIVIKVNVELTVSSANYFGVLLQNT